MKREVEGIGKTHEEAIRDGLNKIGLRKDQVLIEEIKEPKKTFFSILEPRQVKVKITELDHKEDKKEDVKEVKRETKKEETRPQIAREPREIVELDPSEIEEAKEKATTFVTEFVEKLGIELTIDVNYKENMLCVDLNGEKAGLIIGYRGETIDALQVLLSAILNKNKANYIKVLVDAENYRKKRVKTLEELAKKEAERVIQRRKSVTLEPMVAFERKVIHTALQDNSKVKSESVGEEPYRKVVISLR